MAYRPKNSVKLANVQKKFESKFARNDTMILSGKWIWINSSDGKGDLHRFKVRYQTERGEVKSCLSRSMLSKDVSEAILMGGSYD